MSIAASSATSRRDAALARLSEKGLRRTVARAAIITALAGTSHLTAGQLHRILLEKNLEIDASTIHRTVDTLANCGILHCVPTTSGATYGLADQPHHHAVCTQCGGIAELPDHSLGSAVARVAEASHHTLRPDDVSGGLVLYATCLNCT